jgi:hypothetical protein
MTAVPLREAGIMANIHVHARLKECCRDELKKLDRAMAKLEAEGRKPSLSLHDTLGEVPVHQAIGKVPQKTPGSGAPSGLRKHVQDVCVSICTRHASAHSGEEAVLWRLLGGQDPPSAQGVHTEHPKPSQEHYAFMFFGWADLILMENSPKILPRLPIEQLPKELPPDPIPTEVKPATPGEGGSGSGQNPNQNPNQDWYQKYQDLINGKKSTA